MTNEDTHTTIQHDSVKTEQKPVSKKHKVGFFKVMFGLLLPISIALNAYLITNEAVRFSVLHRSETVKYITEYNKLKEYANQAFNEVLQAQSDARINAAKTAVCK